MEERHFGPIHFIPGLNKGNYPCCNSLYIEGAGVLIDPSSNRERLIRLRDETDIKEVWLSHHHEDHIMHLDLFDDLPLKMSKEDSGKLANIESFMDYDWFGIDDEDHRRQWTTTLEELFHFKSRKPAAYLQDGDVVTHDDVSINVIHTPGHTSGNLSFYFPEQRVLFVGDYDLSKLGPMCVDRTSSIQDSMSSVDLLRKIPANVWITSHSNGIHESDPAGKWDLYLRVISQREEKLLSFLAEPRTLDEITDNWIVYGKPMEPLDFYKIAERAVIKKHLEMLLEKNVIASDGKRYRKL